jgi:hypothetical protein
MYFYFCELLKFGKVEVSIFKITFKEIKDEVTGVIDAFFVHYW